MHSHVLLLEDDTLFTVLYLGIDRPFVFMCIIASLTIHYVYIAVRSIRVVDDL